LSLNLKFVTRLKELIIKPPTKTKESNFNEKIRNTFNYYYIVNFTFTDIYMM